MVFFTVSLPFHFRSGQRSGSTWEGFVMDFGSNLESPSHSWGLKKPQYFPSEVKMPSKTPPKLLKDGFWRGLGRVCGVLFLGFVATWTSFFDFCLHFLERLKESCMNLSMGTTALPREATQIVMIRGGPPPAWSNLHPSLSITFEFYIILRNRPREATRRPAHCDPPPLLELKLVLC